MNRRRLVAALCALLAGVGVAAERAEAGSTDEQPELVLDTVEGAVVIRLAPADAPVHVAALLDAIADGGATRWDVDRVAPAFYVQLGAVAATGVSGLDHEDGRGIGNVRGAVSVYDGPDSTPTLLLLLTDSHQLDDRYTPVGWVESGLDAAERIAARAADGDGVLAAPLTVGPLRRVEPGDRSAGLTARTGAPGTLPVASVVLIVVAAAGSAALGLLHRRLPAAAVTTGMLAVALVGFFAAWTASIGHTAGRPTAALALFIAVIALFRLMGRFEQPRSIDEGATVRTGG